MWFFKRIILFLESENASLNCDKESSMFCMKNDSSQEGYLSLTYSYNNVNTNDDNSVEKVLKRNVKKSIGFQRHSVHQINISNKVRNV